MNEVLPGTLIIRSGATFVVLSTEAGLFKAERMVNVIGPDVHGIFRVLRRWAHEDAIKDIDQWLTGTWVVIDLPAPVAGVDTLSTSRSELP